MQRTTTPTGATEEYLARLRNAKFDKGKEPPWVTAYKTRAGKAVQVPTRPSSKGKTPRARLQQQYGRPRAAGTPVPAGANSMRAHLIETRKVGIRRDAPGYTRNRP